MRSATSKTFVAAALLWLLLPRLATTAGGGSSARGIGVLGGGINGLAIGIGMIPRGEVGLIFAGIGVRMTLGAKRLLTQGMFSAIVLMVLMTTLLASVGLRWAFSPSRKS